MAKGGWIVKFDNKVERDGLESATSLLGMFFID